MPCNSNCHGPGPQPDNIYFIIPFINFVRRFPPLHSIHLHKPAAIRIQIGFALNSSLLYAASMSDDGNAISCAKLFSLCIIIDTSVHMCYVKSLIKTLFIRLVIALSNTQVFVHGKYEGRWIRGNSSILHLKKWQRRA